MKVLHFFIFLFLISCTVDNKKDHTAFKNISTIENNFVFIKDSLYTFNLDSTMNSYCYDFSLQAFIASDGIEYFAYENSFQNDILIYNIDSQVLEYEVHINKNGPNNIGSIGNFFIKDLDSIYITPWYKTELALVNRQGKLISKYDYNKGDKMVFNYNNFFIHKNFVYIPQVPTGDLTGLTYDKLSEMHTCARFNTSTDTGELLPIKYPLFYDYNMPVISRYFSMVLNSETLYFSFLHSHKIYFTNDMITLNAKEAKSEYFEEFPIAPSNLTSKDVHGYPEYLHLLFDQYRNIFYRIVKQPRQIEVNENTKELALYPETFSIIILDKNLDRIREVLFPKNTYQPRMIFVGKAGLYISENHIKNPNFTEDCLRFRLFKIQ